MYNDNRPLQTLAAFAICFASGLASAAALNAYTAWLKRKTRQAANKHAD